MPLLRSSGFGASQGRPHVASLFFLTDRTNVEKNKR